MNGGCVRAAPDGHMDVMVDARGVDRPMIGSRRISKGAALGIDAREFRAHQYQLRGVVHPDQQNDEGGRGAIRRFEALFADVKADEQLADLEEGGRDGGAEPDVAPGDIGVRQPLEHHGEQERDHPERQEAAEGVHRHFRHVGSKVFAAGSQRGRQQQGHQQQEPQRKHGR